MSSLQCGQSNGLISIKNLISDSINGIPQLVQYILYCDTNYINLKPITAIAIKNMPTGGATGSNNKPTTIIQIPLKGNEATPRTPTANIIIIKIVTNIIILINCLLKKSMRL